jgi:hypothetical protein
MQPTPLCGPKIVAILKAGFARWLSRSISAARLMGKPLGGGHQSPDQSNALVEFSPA